MCTALSLHWIDYAVVNGVITVTGNTKVLDRGPDDTGLSILVPQAQWSPDGDCSDALGTCAYSDANCVASTSGSCGADLDLTSFSHVSVSNDDLAGPECAGGTEPRVLIAGTKNGDAKTVILDGTGTMGVLALEGHDWTSNCTILGVIGDSIVEFNPWSPAGGTSTSLVSCKVSVPDSIN